MANKRKFSLMHSMQVKYALTYIAVIAAVLVLLNTYPVLASQNLIFKSKQTSLQNQAAVVASALAGLENLTAEGVEQVMNQLDDAGLTRIIVTDDAGMILYDTVEGGGTLYQYALIREVADALGGNVVFYSAYADGRFQSRAAWPVVYRNVNIGAVFLYEEDTEQGALLQGMQSNLRSVSMVVVVLVLLMSIVFSKALTGRVAALLRAIRIVREGNYSHRVQLKGGDELAQLADEFNQLTGRLQTTEEVRRRFVSDASHELKTPLASIRLLTDSILQSENMDPETAREFVSDIGEEADRLTRISEKLLTLTRLDAEPEVERTPVDMAAVVSKVERMLRPLAQAGEVTLESSLEEGCRVYATGDDLSQVAFNLMENAVKYNLPGGRVMVNLKREGDEIVFRVEDTGVGIPEEELGKIFNRFYRVDKARSRAAGGTGLGLSIVRDTVRQHGGTVTASRREPEGSCFTVRFPAWKEGGEKA
ncbi:MAG: sensor histidine kinase [Oscillospiraceae bacterium]